MNYYELIKKYYTEGYGVPKKYYTDEQVDSFVPKFITEEQASEIKSLRGDAE